MGELIEKISWIGDLLLDRCSQARFNDTQAAAAPLGDVVYPSSRRPLAPVIDPNPVNATPDAMSRSSFGPAGRALMCQASPPASRGGLGVGILCFFKPASHGESHGQTQR
jgi:hypothetical protein